MAYTPYNNTVKSLTGELGKMERDMAKYLFRKYLVPPNTPETKEQIRARREIFIQELFPTRPETIEQDDELVSELDALERATEEYTRCADDYPTGRTQWGYPDSLRCKHISYIKHRFSRCACKISTTPTSNPRPFCTKHFAVDNPYEAEYDTLVAAQLALQNQTTN